MNSEKNSIISKRYAKSLSDIVNNNSEISMEKISQDLNNIETILKNSNDLYFVLSNPIISLKDKEEIIDVVFQNDTSDSTRNMLKILVQKNRFNLIYSIIKDFLDLVNEINNIIDINIICATDINDENKDKIKKKLEEKLKKQVNIEYNINESIIAGLIYKIGDNVFDTSLNHKIEELKKEIIK